MPGLRETAAMNSAALREAFLAPDLFVPGEIRLVVTDMDRLALGGAMPAAAALRLPACEEFGTDYFTERREVGVVNLGAPGHVRVGGQKYSLGRMDFLYIGTGQPDIEFERCGESPPCFYFLSCPAHQRLPVTPIVKADAAAEVIGDPEHASRRTLRKYIHPGGARSCQLVMGMTELAGGSVWNTMPPHTHLRRTEVYLYCDLGEGLVVHMLGDPAETRHLMVRNREAVFSPAWSIHCGVGTEPYCFVWGMAGENQAFSDMDRVELGELR